MAAKSSKEFRRLRKASNRHQCHLAIAIGRDYCARFPTHSPAWLHLGRALGEAKQYDEGRDALKHGLGCAPVERSTHFYAQLGHLEALAGNYPAAEGWFRQAFDNAAPDSIERLFYGEICYQQGKLHEAEALARQVVSVWNESLNEAWHLLGEILATRGEYAQSLDCFQRAAESAPTVRKHVRRVRELTKLIGRSP